MLAGGMSCLRTVLDRHCAIAPGESQISAVKWVGIVDANKLSARLPQMGAVGQKVNETRTPDARSRSADTYGGGQQTGAVFTEASAYAERFRPAAKGYGFMGAQPQPCFSTIVIWPGSICSKSLRVLPKGSRQRFQLIPRGNINLAFATPLVEGCPRTW